MSRKNKKKKIEIIPRSATVPVLSWWILGATLAVWTVVVLRAYLPLFPTGGLSVLLADMRAGAGAAVLARAGESALHLGFVLMLGLAAVGVGGFIFRLMAPAEAAAGGRLYFMLAAGLGALALALFGIGSLGLLVPSVWGAVLVCCAGAGVYFIRRGGATAVSVPPLGGWEKMGLLLIGALALFNLPGALSPELFYDAQYYQSAIPLKWLLDGRIAPTEYQTASFFPFNINMLFMFAQMFGNDITAKVVAYACGLAVCWGIYRFCTAFFSREVGILAAVIFYAVPQVMVGSWKAAVELGIAVFDLASVFALMYYVARQERRWLIAAGVFCGLSLGSKYTSLAFCYVPSVTAIVAAALFQRRGIAQAVRDAALFSLVALTVSAPWYLRNVIESGNPVFPFLWDKIGHLKLPTARSLFSDPPLPPFTVMNYVLFPWPMTMGTLQRETMLGPLFLIFLPCLFLLKKIDVKIKILLVYAACAVVLWAVVGRFYMRYFIPTLPVVSIIFAYYITSFSSAFVRRAAYLLIAWIAFANASYAALMLQTMHAPLPYVLGGQSRSDYLSRQRPGYPAPSHPALAYANKNVPRDAVILFVGETRGLFSERRFIASGPSERAPLADWLRESPDADRLYDRLRRAGVTHILLNVPEAMRLKGYDMLDWSGGNLRVLDDFWRAHVREVFRDVADAVIPERGIRSLKNDDPARWQQYSSSPYNYVYLYEVLPRDAAAKIPAPHNFLLDRVLYPDARWQSMIEKTQVDQ